MVSLVGGYRSSGIANVGVSTNWDITSRFSSVIHRNHLILTKIMFIM